MTPFITICPICNKIYLSDCSGTSCDDCPKSAQIICSNGLINCECDINKMLYYYINKNIQLKIEIDQLLNKGE